MSDDIVAVFDEDFYIRSYGKPGGSTTPIEHYRQFGWHQGFDPSPAFDVSWYLDQHPDLRDAECDPLEFYLTVGWQRGDDPAPWFDGGWYRAVNGDVAASGINPLVHYATTGLVEGRAVSAAHFNALVQVPPRRSASAIVSQVQPVAALCEPDGRRITLPVDAIEYLDVDLMTFDLWDTLLRRTRPADAAKVATARRLLIERPSLGGGVWDPYCARVTVEAQLAGENEHEEYEIHDVLDRWLGHIVIDAQERSRLVTLLAAAEVADEIAGTVPIQAVASLFTRLVATAPTRGFRIAILSDFYIGADDLSALLESHGLGLPRSDIHVSCDIGASKRLGTSFGLVESTYGVEPSRHVHIGDHPLSDGQRANERGVRAALFRHDDGLVLPPAGSLTPHWYSDAVEALEDDLKQLARVGAPEHSHTMAEKRAFAAGVSSALLPVAHVAGAVEHAMALGVDKVYYLSREGSFLCRVHDSVAAILAEGGPPQARHLQVSRRSTFGPSLRTTEPSELMRMWAQYRNQSPRALLTSLGLDPQDYAVALRAFGLAVDDVVDDIAASQLVHEFLGDRVVSEQMSAELMRNRSTLLSYLDDSGFTDSMSVVADIGWRGTIQDNLCHLLPTSEIHGVYLGLFPYLNPQPTNARKSAVVFDGNLGESFVHVSPPAALESPWTPPIPTVLGYERCGDGRVIPTGPAEHHRADGLIKAFQVGVLRSAPVVARWMVSVGATTELIRAGLQQALVQYYKRPSPGVADIWFESAHDDTFGALNQTPFGKTRVTSEFLCMPEGAQEHPAAAASLWPEGYAAWLPIQAATFVAGYRSGVAE